MFSFAYLIIPHANYKTWAIEFIFFVKEVKPTAYLLAHKTLCYDIQRLSHHHADPLSGYDSRTESRPRNQPSNVIRSFILFFFIASRVLERLEFRHWRSLQSVNNPGQPQERKRPVFLPGTDRKQRRRGHRCIEILLCLPTARYTWTTADEEEESNEEGTGTGLLSK